MTDKPLGEKIKEMLEQGIRWSRIEKDLNVSGSTISYHKNRQGISPNKNTRRYDWNEIQAFYDDGHTLTETSRKFHISAVSLRDNAKRGNFTLADGKSSERKKLTQTARNNSRGWSWTFNESFCENSPIPSSSLKRKLGETNLIPDGCSNRKCALFGIEDPTWAGEKITLQLDHVNGIRDDNRLENLRWLCPNCHSQTSTYCGRNNRK